MRVCFSNCSQSAGKLCAAAGKLNLYFVSVNLRLRLFGNFTRFFFAYCFYPFADATPISSWCGHVYAFHYYSKQPGGALRLFRYYFFLVAGNRCFSQLDIGKGFLLCTKNIDALRAMLLQMKIIRNVLRRVWRLRKHVLQQPRGIKFGMELFAMELINGLINGHRLITRSHAA